MNRLANKVALVIGAGQTEGQGVGNGRATALLFARQGAKVACVDRSLEAAQETVELIRAENNSAEAYQGDVTDELTLKRMVCAVVDKYRRIDVLHNNVGVSIAAGDTVLEELTEEAFDAVFAVNLRGMMMICKQVVPMAKRTAITSRPATCCRRSRCNSSPATKTGP